MQKINTKIRKLLVGTTCTLVVLAVLLSLVNTGVLATSSPWTQSDWSGGSGQQNWSDNSKFDLQSGVDTSVANQVTLVNPQKFTNTGFEANLDNWNGGTDPASIAGMQLWLKADSLTSKSNGDPVSSWTDSSGNDNNAVQADSGRYPTYAANAINGQPSVRFNGTSQGLIVPTNSGLDAVNGFAVFIVSKANTSGANQVLVYKGVLDYGNNYNYRIIEWTDGNQYGGLGSPSGEIFYPFGTTNPGNYQLLSSYWNGNNLKAYVNGNLAGSAAAAVTGQTYPNDLQIGYSNVGNNYFFNGDISEIIIYNSVITDAQRQEVEAYLQAKYGISSGYGTISRDSVTTHQGSGAAKIVVGSNATNFVQTVNVGNTDDYDLSAYIKTDGTAVTASDAQLYYNGSTVSTTYTAAGNGWYKLSATVTGVAIPRGYGIQVKSGVTAYMDDASLTDATTPGASGTLSSSIFDSGFNDGADWSTLSYSANTPASTSAGVKLRTGNQANMSDASSFSVCRVVPSGSSASSNTCVSNGDRYAQYQVSLNTTDDLVLPAFTDFTLAFTKHVNPPPSTQPPTILPSPSSSPSSAVSTSTNSDIEPSQTTTTTTSPTSNNTPTPPTPANVNAQKYNLSVKITQNGQPLVGAEVTLHSKPIIAITGSDGIAHFYNVPAGKHSVLVSYRGYSSKEQTISLSGANTNISLALAVQLNSKQASIFNTYTIVIILLLILVICSLLFILFKRRKKRKIT